MLRQLALSLPVVVLLAGALAPRAEAQSAPLAERAPEVALMLERLGVYDVLGIMAAEGEAAALTLEDEMFPGEGGAAWIAEASRLQSADRMTDLFEEFFPVAQMSAEQVAQVTRFFESEPGLSISEAEVAGRRAFLDPSAEEAANAAFRQAVSAGDPRVDLLTGFIEANDLVERNVQGALNSNFAFYRGLADGEAFAVEMPEELMLSEVWGQEPQLRRDTIEWLYSFQLSAYSGLADGDIEAYTAFSETEAGRALNRALFTAFDAVFEQLSYELGFAAARFIAGEDA
jgi:hypothetical protein